MTSNQVRKSTLSLFDVTVDCDAFLGVKGSNSRRNSFDQTTRSPNPQGYKNARK